MPSALLSFGRRWMNIEIFEIEQFLSLWNLDDSVSLLHAKQFDEVFHLILKLFITLQDMHKIQQTSFEMWDVFLWLDMVCSYKCGRLINKKRLKTARIFIFSIFFQCIIIDENDTKNRKFHACDKIVMSNLLLIN